MSEALPLPGRRRNPIAPDAVVGMAIFIIAEVMFFSALVSSHTIVRAGAGDVWPPLGQPRLPVAETAVNTGALILSGVALFLASRDFAREPRSATRALLATLLLGLFFLVFQGAEWVALLGEGLTLSSSNHGSFFYLIVGTHALHVLAALAVLLVAFLRLRRGNLAPAFFKAARMFLVLCSCPLADSLLASLFVKLWGWALLALLLTESQSAMACPVCFSAKNDASRVAFLNTTVFMSILPLLMLAVALGWAVRRLREQDRGEAGQADNAQIKPVESETA